MSTAEIRHFHLFCGLGGGAKGFNQASPRVGNLRGVYRCIGGIDVDPASIRDFGRLAGTTGTVLDLFDRQQYIDFHGHQPPADWREAMPQDIQRAAGGERPHIVFLSAPCKGFSGLLSEAKSKTVKYQALNRLTLRGVWLMLEAWADHPPELVLFENVPRLATRGRALLDQITAMLRAYGYAVAETTHDCGELGGLAQSRKRFLLVARHIEQVPPMLYQPTSRPLRAVGDVLGRMLLPGDLRAGPMHRIPALQWKTWVRLAFVKAGGDWRSLHRLAVDNGHLSDYLIVPDMHTGTLGVRRWGDHCGTVTGNARPATGAFSVADPRAPDGAAQYQQYGVREWSDTSGAVSGQSKPGGGVYSAADPRCPGTLHSNAFRVVKWADHAMTVTGGLGSVGGCVADPRNAGADFAKYGVADWERAAGTVISGSTTGQGAYAPADKLVCRIVAEDGTWHRPFTTLELAALQSLVDPEEQLELDGLNDQAWRERIGNAVPSAAAQAIAEVMGRTLLLAWSGETFELSSQPIWVRPMAVALSMQQDGAGAGGVTC